MVLNSLRQLTSLRLVIAIAAVCTALPTRADTGIPDPVMQKIEAGNTRLEMTVNASRILTMDQKIPRVQIANPDLVDFTALAANQVQLHAKKPGITSVNLWDESGEVHTIDLVILGDVRELDRLLRAQFPTAALKLVPTAASTLIIFGYVDRPDYVNRIMRIAEDYYPKVLNNMTVGGSQQVVLHVKVMEVSRTNLRTMGFDFMNFSGNNFVGSSAAGIITKANATQDLFRNGAAFTTNGRETFQFGIVSDPSGFVGMLEALKQENILKVLAEPKIVTVSGRPAYFQVGGLVPYPQPTGFGNISIAFRPFGTQIDFVPIVLGNGNVRLEVKPQISEIDPTLSITVAGTSVPGFRLREVDTGVELKFGQTLALAGLLQQRTAASKQGIPYLMDIPYLGAAFRRNTNSINEVELLILVRPELAEGLDADQVPPCGPGMNTSSPDDCGLYWKGYVEVPVKPGPGPMPPPGPGGVMPTEPVLPGPPAPAAEELPSARSQPRSRGSVVVSDGPSARTASAAGRRIPSTQQNANPAPADSYNPRNPSNRKTSTPANPSSGPPGFIGPRGYDVRN